MKTTSTPIETNKALLKAEEAKDVDVHLYKSMIGSLMYLTASRPDIMFIVCACARFQVTPKVSHLHAVKRIFRYLKDLLTKAFDVSSIRDKFGNKTGSCKAKHIEYIVLNASPQKQAKRGQDTKIPQSGGLPEKVGDEAVHKELGDRMKRAATTASIIVSSGLKNLTCQEQILKLKLSLKNSWFHVLTNLSSIRTTNVSLQIHISPIQC
ncbi:hypothetical protein Tco_1022219 [Tanacetum coccineum]